MLAEKLRTDLDLCNYLQATYVIIMNAYGASKNLICHHAKQIKRPNYYDPVPYP